jgi:hypothetical protein
MGRSARTPPLNVRQGGLQVLLGQRDPELVAQHVSIFVFALKGPAFNFTRGVTHVEPRVEQGEPRASWARQRRDHVVEIRALRMCSSKPIADFVFGIKSRKPYDAVDVLPSLSETGLQCQFLSHLDEAHDFVRSVLLYKRCELQRCGWG